MFDQKELGPILNLYNLQEGCSTCEASQQEAVELQRLLLVATAAAAEARGDAQRLEAAAHAAAEGSGKGELAVARQRAADLDMAAKSYRCVFGDT